MSKSVLKVVTKSNITTIVYLHLLGHIICQLEFYLELKKNLSLYWCEQALIWKVGINGFFTNTLWHALGNTLVLEEFCGHEQWTGIFQLCNFLGIICPFYKSKGMGIAGIIFLPTGRQKQAQACSSLCFMN